LREEAVPKPCLCACCSSQIEPAQELRFLVESANLDNPIHLARIRQLPAVGGRPVPVCKACQTLVEAAPLRLMAKPSSLRAGVLAAVGLFTVGWLVQSLLFGPCE
jgi:hypothetical protein